MGRAAYSTGVTVLPVPAREKAEQCEHEDDDEDDPENAHADPPFVCMRTVLPQPMRVKQAANAKEPPAGDSFTERAGTILADPASSEPSQV